MNYLDTGNITENKIASIQTIDLSKEELPSRAKRKVRENSIVYSTVRPNQRHYGIIKTYPQNFLVSTGFAVIDADSQKLDADFLYYALTQSTIVDKLHAIAEQSTSAYPSIKASDIENLEIDIPPLNEQRVISSVLRCLGEKIALNTSMNQNLEAQAQAIFKSWFVDFEPFQDGKFVDSELGLIPDGWQIGMLKDVLNLIKEPISTTSNSLPYLPIDTIPMKSLGISGFRPHEEAQSSLIRFSRNDILIGAMRVYFHRVVLAPCDGITRTTCFVLRSKNECYREYNLLLCNQDSSIDYAQNTSKGSTMPYAVWDGAFSNLRIVIPPIQILEHFSQLTRPIINMIRDAYVESHRLAALRDTLLPKLMSGEIDVSKVEV